MTNEFNDAKFEAVNDEVLEDVSGGWRLPGSPERNIYSGVFKCSACSWRSQERLFGLTTPGNGPTCIIDAKNEHKAATNGACAGTVSLDEATKKVVSRL